MIEILQDLDTLSFVFGLFTCMILDILFAFLNWMTRRAFDRKRRELECKDLFKRLDQLEQHQKAIEQHFLGEEYPWE